jgi:plasmid replication initiation protein
MLKQSLPKVLQSKTSKVYKNNKLNTANFGNFTHNDYQVFLYLVSKIGGVDELGKYLQPEQLQREHVLTAKEFSEVFNTDISNSYKFIHKACKKLMRTSISIKKIELNETWEINICSTAKYREKEGRITIQFTDSIMPYLSQVKKKFVLYNLKEIADFNSLYTTRLYEIIQDFKETGWMLKSVKQLREVFAVGDSFKLYGDFKRYTFDRACQEINSKYAMNLVYEEIKESRKVVAIKFRFKKTGIYKFTNRKTGVKTNHYIKPERKSKKLKDKTKITNPDILEGQMSFKKEPKPIQNILSKMFDKFKS